MSCRAPAPVAAYYRRVRSATSRPVGDLDRAAGHPGLAGTASPVLESAAEAADPSVSWSQPLRWPDEEFAEREGVTLAQAPYTIGDSGLRPGSPVPRGSRSRPPAYELTASSATAQGCALTAHPSASARRLGRRADQILRGTEMSETRGRRRVVRPINSLVEHWERYAELLR